MLTTTACWESKRIRRQAPGLPGLLALLFFPLLFITPFERLGWFQTSFEPVLLLGWAYAFVIAANLGADTGELSDGAFWLFQKGVSIADHALARWLVACAWGLGFIALGALTGTLALVLYSDLELPRVVVYLASTALVFLIAQALYFLTVALKLQRKSETLLLLMVLALAQGILFRGLPAAVRRLLHFVLPPIQDAAATPSALVNAEWIVAIGHVLHIVLFAFACMAVAFALHRRWRPTMGRMSRAASSAQRA
jgi:hypothetical protein